MDLSSGCIPIKVPTFQLLREDCNRGGLTASALVTPDIAPTDRELAFCPLMPGKL